MSEKMKQFKDEIANRHLVRIEDRIREIWPRSEPKVTLLVRTPWLTDGGIIITNDSLDNAIAELQRLKATEPIT